MKQRSRGPSHWWFCPDKPPVSLHGVDMDLLTYGGQLIERAHYAQGGGEEQPRYDGWFEAVRDARGKLLFFRETLKPEFYRRTQ